MNNRTRIITLMFHRVNDATLGYDPSVFEKYLDYLCQHFPIVVPGETLPNVSVAICLTFDDAYYDFYHNVYPLLKKYNIKALLAVPVMYIVESTNVSAKCRIAVPYIQGMEDPNYHDQVPFCTWEEIKEMSQSSHVIIASHGFSHANLAMKNADLTKEILHSQEILQEKLNTPITNFVYPYGRINFDVHKKVCQHYKFGIRIGSALNLGWDESRHFIYRINADPLWTGALSINNLLIKKLTLKYWINRLRLK